MRALIAFIILAGSAMAMASSAAASPKAREGWAVHETRHTYDVLIDRVKAAARTQKMGVVTQAGPTGAARNRGITIPGNRVIGLFNNRYAVDMLRASEAAMIEAPVRVYVTEQPDGTATLSYKTPSLVFAPYADESPEVMALAAELDAIFAAIAADAVR